MLDFAILEFIMFDGQFVFSQLTSFLPLKSFRKIVNHYHGDRYIKRFTCMDQYLAMTFAQLTYRDIEVSLRAKQNNLYHIGIRSPISRNTLAKANAQRNWRIYVDFAQKLITITRPLYANEDLGLELDNTVYAVKTQIWIAISAYILVAIVKKTLYQPKSLHYFTDFKFNPV